ncbi:1-acyl-sn-glycerol-3-phosphate acyltransferase [Nocardioides marmoribigeumensis]|uniref:1-acyl-sn-glycerol-3-phosphate acyltransferase n=1 Tax=Nocardioides marmoribigeumensis TaxID=433649 RepID=A0ABU2BZB5_9ACTN|nr:1-acyl-sn-glycerol-3-phosphate acyltransferase [Nocardioides marmoribigeumensis]MDR7363750.1 1-acyl-sn-glycerol-3-phosphate acyltransferase [Nocardioides marmoribigeumensis]
MHIPFLGPAVSAATAPARGVVSALTPRFRPGDLDDRDPDFMRELLPGLWLLVSAWYRPDIRGLENIPREGPVLVVGNHSGGTSSPEVFISQLAISTYFGVERQHFQLAHRMVLNSPLGWMLRRFGTIEADHGNAEQALDAGAVVTVFPGGDYEVFRPSWQSGRIDMGGRKGFLRLALAKGVPVVPMVSLGGQETALFLSRGEGLARLLRLDRSIRLKTLPVMLSLPFGLQVGPQPHLPLPVKVAMRFLPPVDLAERFGDDADVDEVYDALVAEMQAALTEMQGERRFPVLG